MGKITMSKESLKNLLDSRDVKEICIEGEDIINMDDLKIYDDDDIGTLQLNFEQNVGSKYEMKKLILVNDIDELERIDPEILEDVFSLIANKLSKIQKNQEKLINELKAKEIKVKL